MGGCFSSQSTPTPSPLLTTKVIMSNGGVVQFSWPIMASHVLGKEESSCFVCDMDLMEIDRNLSAISGDAKLRLGQIYFVLPRSMLNRPLKGKEMAELAVKASVALAEAGEFGRRGRRGVVAPFDFAVEEKGEELKKGSGDKGFKFAPDLWAIPE